MLIWGTLEARVQGADLVILGGLNEGSWPEPPPPDPWLNRAMRHEAGLLLPERRIGLSAHDFQQAIAARRGLADPRLRADEAETVPSRWLNRLTNLLAGCRTQGGDDALAAMRARGRVAGARRSAGSAGPRAAPAPRPAPCPPSTRRPDRLSVTEIKRLIRDPYAIYARYILSLRPLDPLLQAPDAPLRGIVLHEVLERFIKDSAGRPATPDARGAAGHRGGRAGCARCPGPRRGAVAGAAGAGRRLVHRDREARAAQLRHARRVRGERAGAHWPIWTSP